MINGGLSYIIRKLDMFVRINNFGSRSATVNFEVESGAEFSYGCTHIAQEFKTTKILDGRYFKNVFMTTS